MPFLRNAQKPCMSFIKIYFQDILLFSSPRPLFSLSLSFSSLPPSLPLLPLHYNPASAGVLASIDKAWICCISAVKTV